MMLSHDGIIADAAALKRRLSTPREFALRLASGSI
jgi:hypothetical protein